MIGIEFILNDNKFNLYKFFYDVDLTQYNIYIVQDEVIHDNLNFEIKENNMILKSEVMNYELNIIFLNLQAYSRDCQQTCIKSYNDYKNSNCEFLLLISDGNCIEFYCKNNSLLEKIIKNCKKYFNVKIEIKTELNDSRIIMEV